MLFSSATLWKKRRKPGTTFPTINWRSLSLYLLLPSPSRLQPAAFPACSGHQHHKQGWRPSQGKGWEILPLPCFIGHGCGSHLPHLSWCRPGWAHSAALSDNTLLWTAWSLLPSEAFLGSLITQFSPFPSQQVSRGSHWDSINMP